MKLSYLKGISFGLTSGIITTLGMMVGLQSGTNSKLAVLGGILTIAIADAFSDALGIHISEESENVHSKKEVWESTIATFSAKLIFALTFVIPVLLLTLGNAIMVSIAWGMLVLGFISFWMAREQKSPAWHVIGEHWSIALLVIFITHFVGEFISNTFGSIG
jgi:VIT1/CCC1 family predicted Fe2+/Mn2+ transporter